VLVIVSPGPGFAPAPPGSRQGYAHLRCAVAPLTQSSPARRAAAHATPAHRARHHIGQLHSTTLYHLARQPAEAVPEPHPSPRARPVRATPWNMECRRTNVRTERSSSLASKNRLDELASATARRALWQAARVRFHEKAESSPRGRPVSRPPAAAMCVSASHRVCRPSSRNRPIRTRAGSNNLRMGDLRRGDPRMGGLLRWGSEVGDLRWGI
jgi:hypothetical protein